MDRAERTIKGSPGLIDYLGGQELTSEVKEFDFASPPFHCRPAARRIEAEGNTARAA
jgi:hypothetical protein